MKPEVQRIAIAEACGVDVKRCPTHHSRTCCGRSMPDYLNDLNAMHEAEKVLSPKQKPIYCSELWELCVTPYSNHKWKMLHATAAQRAEAFLETLGLWKKEPVSEAKQKLEALEKSSMLQKTDRRDEALRAISQMHYKPASQIATLALEE